jgi:hypothetical protein
MTMFKLNQATLVGKIEDIVMGNLEMRFYNQIFCLAKALDEHGIILNYDDAQMGRVSPKLVGEGFGIPLSKVYPIKVPEDVKEQMAALEIKDFWDFYFYRETKALKEEVELEKREAERKPKKKRWIFR